MDHVHLKMAPSSSATDAHVVKNSRPVNTLSKAKVKDKPLRARVDMSSSPGVQNFRASNSATDHVPTMPSKPRLRMVSSQTSLRRPAVSNSSTRVNAPLSQSTSHTSAPISQPRPHIKPVSANAFISKRSSTVDVAPTQDLRHSHSNGAPRLLPSARISHTAKVIETPISTQDEPSTDFDPEKTQRNPLWRNPKVYPGHHSGVPAQQRPPLSSMGMIRATPLRSKTEPHIQSRQSPSSPSCDVRSISQRSPSRSPHAKEANERFQQGVMARSPFATARIPTDPSIPPSPAEPTNSTAPASSTPTLPRQPFVSTSNSVLSSGMTDTSVDVTDIWDAKHERKLLDLEISNKSLMAINAALESSKVKLTREVRELRQQYLAKTIEPSVSEDGYGIDHVHTAFAEIMKPNALSPSSNLGDALAEAMAEQDRELEQIHSRCRATIDQLVEQARSAILLQPGPDMIPAAKVLHPSELSLSKDTLDTSMETEGTWSPSQSYE